MLTKDCSITSAIYVQLCLSVNTPGSIFITPLTSPVMAGEN